MPTSAKPPTLRQAARPLRTAACGLCLLLATTPVHALRCGNLLVMEGDYTITVLQKCGPPQYRDERVEYRGIRLKGIGLEQDIFEPVRVEEWLYNFGPQLFMQMLRFENGRLVEIKTLGYGQ